MCGVTELESRDALENVQVLPPLWFLGCPSILLICHALMLFKITGWEPAQGPEGIQSTAKLPLSTLVWPFQSNR